MKRQAFVQTAVGSLTLASVTRTARAATQARWPLRVGYVPSALFAPLFVAIDRGYLAAEGFDVQASPIRAGQDSITGRAVKPRPSGRG